MSRNMKVDTIYNHYNSRPRFSFPENCSGILLTEALPLRPCCFYLPPLLPTVSGFSRDPGRWGSKCQEREGPWKQQPALPKMAFLQSSHGECLMGKMTCLIMFLSGLIQFSSVLIFSHRPLMFCNYK